MTTLHIKTAHITIGHPALATAILRACVDHDDEPGTSKQEPHAIPAIGQYWPGQGGVFAGNFRGDDGTVYGLILADCGDTQDLGRATWGANGEQALSDWDGLANIRKLGNDCPAAKLAAQFTLDGHTDFYLPARRELQLAGANLQHLFGKESWYWTSTPYSSDYAWAVGFEDGRTRSYYRDAEFRVRPVRRFIY